jgi:hypothetical protein
LTAPLAVPVDFIGVNAPNSKALNLHYKTARLHDSRVQWKDIAKPGGNDWSVMDALVASMAGKTLCWPLYGVPTALSATPAVKDIYNSLGGAGPASNPADAAAFAVAVVNRYPTIALLETWNETQPSYWGGTPEQLVTQCAAVYKAVKAAKPNVTVLGPAFTNTSVQAARFLSALDPISGLYGYQTLDALSIHPYTATALNDTTGLAWTGNSGVERVRSIMAGISTIVPPVYMTEWAIASSQSDPAIAAFLALPPDSRKSIIGRTAMKAAVLGVRSFMAYSHQAPFSGDLVNDVGGSILGLNTINDFISGRVFTSVQEYANGTLRATRSDGTVFVW